MRSVNPWTRANMESAKCWKRHGEAVGVFLWRERNRAQTMQFVISLRSESWDKSVTDYSVRSIPSGACVPDGVGWDGQRSAGAHATVQ